MPSDIASLLHIYLNLTLGQNAFSKGPYFFIS